MVFLIPDKQTREIRGKRERERRERKIEKDREGDKD